MNDRQPRHPLQILLGEDNAHLADLLIGVLEKRGHRVEVTADGERAQRRARDKAFDVIILDAELAHGDGRAAASALIEAGIRVPIVLLTGKTRIQEHLQALTARPVAHLTHHVAFQSLLEDIDAHAARKQDAAGTAAQPMEMDLHALLPSLASVTEEGLAGDTGQALAGANLESPQMLRAAIQTGAHRLNRGWLEIGVSGVIAGMNVTFGAIAAAAVAGATVVLYGKDGQLFANFLGAVVFPIGFIFVVIGRSELFTENFLIPTTTVIAKHARFLQLLRLWSLTLIGNIIGAFIAAHMMSMEYYHGVPGIHIVNYIKALAEHKIFERDWDASMVSGIFAGWLITLMTWLILACRTNVARIIIIWCVGFLIMINEFNHVIVNAAEILMAKYFGAKDITYAAWLEHNFVPTLLGNMIGGLVFVTLLEYLKVMHIFDREHNSDQ